eukprot:15466384-Alexandrium_andersonii.AAC.1
MMNKFSSELLADPMAERRTPDWVHNSWSEESLDCLVRLGGALLRRALASVQDGKSCGEDL